MIVVKNLLKKTFFFTVLVMIIWIIINSMIIYSMHVNDTAEKIKAEKDVINRVIISNYDIGNLVRLNSELETLAISKKWLWAIFSNVNNEILWEYKANPSNDNNVQGAITKSYIINNQVHDSYGKVTFKTDEVHFSMKLIERNFLIMLALIFLWSIFMLITWKLTKETFLPLMEIMTKLKKEGKKVSLDFIISDDNDEISSIINWFEQLTSSWLKKQKEVVNLTKKTAMSEISAQVAHDIRSPLAALDMIMQDAEDMPEDKRVIMRSSVSRINDIANQLLTNYKNKENDKEMRTDHMNTILLSGIIDSILSEKRTQFRVKSNIQISSHLGVDAYGLFSKICIVEFKRIISNIVNNSVEAFGDREGHVSIKLKEDEESNISLSIEDNGKGIPEHLIKELGSKGHSFGKEGGCGLGLYHAKKLIESWGGEIKISSTLNKGTTVVIKLLKSEVPTNFLPELQLNHKSKVVIMDDDASIHQVWESRLGDLKDKYKRFELIHFTDSLLLEKWINAEGKADLFLVDFEFLGQSDNGLSLIKRLNIQEKSVLVTSRFEEKDIIKTCDELKLKLLPKNLAAYIPIKIETIAAEEIKELATILLDDDDLVRMIWDLSAKKKDIDLKAFSEPQELFDNLDSFSKESIFYIDSDLSDNQKGEDIVKELYEKGFLNLHMATGYEASTFSHLKEVKSVIGKVAPW